MLLPKQQQQQQRKHQQQQRPQQQPEQLPQRQQDHHHQLQQQPQQQPQQKPQQQQQEHRQDKQQQQQPQQQPPRSCLKRPCSEKSFAGPDTKQSMRTTPASSIGQRETKTSLLTEGARVGEGKTAWAGVAPEDAVPPAVTQAGTQARMQARTNEQKLEAEENLCVVHNPPPVGVYYSGSGFPLCTCKQRPTWFDLFLGRSADKRADSEDSKGFVHGDSCTSIEAMHKGNWSETSDTASRKLRTLFRKFHSMEDNSVRDDVLPSTAQAICFAFGLLVLLAGTGALLYFVWEVDHEVQVSAVRGRYAGRTRVVGARHVYEFLGISFARDPVRSMRFQQSLAMDRHMLLTKALSMKPGCVQDKDYAMADRDGPVTERCLHLNIWTPMLPGHRCKSECERRTVLVVFVGRDFQFGGNSHSLYRGELLALHANAVVVVPNYRLGPFGFLNGRIVDIKGNAGLHDQKIALDWVLENIEFFGGNPEDFHND
ncbi:uncharacterized protein LOC119440747 [Dermacentor silvarum]|uniref:uncharacterized protein LOC119440747 n=1 Tax=Dermacentor silvarum TaxID=543639 RepID=UPI002100DD6F|nr:uncharacterized protein LOC119440747 [Dermacentor silvarum]